MLSVKAEEIEEQKRHDIRYREVENDELYIEPKHWEKFDSIKKHTHCYTYAVACLGNISGERVLDLGCGTGWFSVILAQRGAQVEGIEISSVAVDIAKKRSEINGVKDRVKFQCMSFYDLDFPDNHFDKIIGLSALHHAEHKRVLGDSMHRILKPGGRVVFNEPFGNSTLLEKIRLFIPVSVNEEDKTHWDDQIKYIDLDVFKLKFQVGYREFQFVSRLDRVVRSTRLVRLMGEFDRLLLKIFKPLRPYARDIVITLDKL